MAYFVLPAHCCAKLSVCLQHSKNDKKHIFNVFRNSISVQIFAEVLIDSVQDCKTPQLANADRAIEHRCRLFFFLLVQGNQLCGKLIETTLQITFFRLNNQKLLL